MEFVTRAVDKPEPISITRCRELLGDDADEMTDDDVERVRRHAETMAAIVVELYEQSGRTVQ
jgi:hypothetical protein